MLPALLESTGTLCVHSKTHSYGSLKISPRLAELSAHKLIFFSKNYVYFMVNSVRPTSLEDKTEIDSEAGTSTDTVSGASLVVCVGFRVLKFQVLVSHAQ